MYENGFRRMLLVTETNRIHLDLFGMQNRTLGPYLAAMYRILIPLTTAPNEGFKDVPQPLPNGAVHGELRHPPGRSLVCPPFLLQPPA
jgi:hypothetical protein